MDTETTFNRISVDKHKQVHDESVAGYIKETSAKLAKKLASLKTGQPEPVQLSLSPPKSRESDYLAAITSLEWSQDDYITLNQEEVRRYIMDEWNWSRDFFQGSLSYSSMGSGVCVSRGYF